jgi:uncharacterized protein (DUF1501 family)
MSVSRRQFIQNGLGFGSLGLAMPGFLVRATDALAAEKSTPGAAGMLKGTDGKILVVIEMAGGNDGLNTVIPYAAAEYSKARPNIGVAKDQVLQIGASGGQNLGLHPRLKGLHELFEKGHAAVITGVGYPNPNRSHFESMDIWQLGDPDSKRAREGWLARYFDADGHLKNTSLPGIAFGEQLPLALNGPGSAAAVIGNGGDYGFGSNAPDKNQQVQAFNAMYAPESNGTTARSNDEFIRNVGNEVYTSTQAIKDAIRAYDMRAGEKANYPNNNGLASRLQTISKLISGGLSTRVYYASIGGFDTHANQPGGHGNQLGALGDAIAAFHKDLELQGRSNDVIVMTFSEFGRRVHENGSMGTDHGAASVLFVAGGGVKGGLYGAYPSMSELDDGDLKMTTDFRCVYSAILDKWLGASSDKVLGGQFAPLKFV